VGDPVGLDPGVGEGVALHHHGDLRAGEALDAVGDRHRQGAKLVGQRPYIKPLAATPRRARAPAARPPGWLWFT
jgi:hypothetical protein